MQISALDESHEKSLYQLSVDRCSIIHSNKGYSYDVNYSGSDDHIKDDRNEGSHIVRNDNSNKNSEHIDDKNNGDIDNDNKYYDGNDIANENENKNENENENVNENENENANDNNYVNNDDSNDNDIIYIQNENVTINCNKSNYIILKDGSDSRKSQKASKVTRNSTTNKKSNEINQSRLQLILSNNGGEHRTGPRSSSRGPALEYVKTQGADTGRGDREDKEWSDADQAIFSKVSEGDREWW